LRCLSRLTFALGDSQRAALEAY